MAHAGISYRRNFCERVVNTKCLIVVLLRQLYICNWMLRTSKEINVQTNRHLKFVGFVRITICSIHYVELNSCSPCSPWFVVASSVSLSLFILTYRHTKRCCYGLWNTWAVVIIVIVYHVLLDLMNVIIINVHIHIIITMER